MVELTMKKSEGFFAKINKFFYYLFSKKTETSEIVEKNENKSTDNVDKNDENNKADNEPSFRETIHEDVQIIENKTRIIDEIEENPDIIMTLSKEQLKDLIKLYDEEIAKINKEIEDFKKQANQANNV